MILQEALQDASSKWSRAWRLENENREEIDTRPTRREDGKHKRETTDQALTTEDYDSLFGQIWSAMSRRGCGKPSKESKTSRLQVCIMGCRGATSACASSTLPLPLPLLSLPPPGKREQGGEGTRGKEVVQAGTADWDSLCPEPSVRIGTYIILGIWLTDEQYQEEPPIGLPRAFPNSSSTQLSFLISLLPPVSFLFPLVFKSWLFTVF